MTGSEKVRVEEYSQTKEEHVILQFNLEIIHNLGIIFT